MDRAETCEIVTFLLACIPNVRMSEEQVNLTTNAWQCLFAEVPYKVARAGCVKLLAEHTVSVFPTPGQLLQAIGHLRDAGVPSAMQAWGEVQAAFLDYGSNREAEALASMSPRTRAVVQRMGWRDMCHSPEDATSVLRGQFVRAYDAMLQRERDVTALPAEVRGMVTGKAMAAIGGVGE